MIDDYSKSHQIATIYSIFERTVDYYVKSLTDPLQSTILTENSIESFLESSLEFLEEADQVHKSYQICSLCGILSPYLLSSKPENNSFEISYDICKSIFKVLLDMQQNLASAVDIWKFISQVLSHSNLNVNSNFLYFIESELEARITKLVSLSNYQESEFNKEILILRNYINSAPKTTVHLVESLSRILLKEMNFAHLSKNCLILKIFQQTFLAGGLGFNIDDLALKTNENGNFEYVWLIGELLNSESLPSLAGYSNLKNQIKVFCETEVLPLMLRECCSESDKTLFIALIQYLTEKSIEKSSLYAKTLGNIVNLIINPPDGLYELVAEFKRWKELLSMTIEPSIQIILD